MSDEARPPFSKEEGRLLFGTVAETYHRVRPRYPAAIFDTLETVCGLSERSAVLEIGPGTGIASEEILRRRPTRFLAVEPDPVLADFLKRTPGIDVLVSALEEATLPAAAFDIAVCATAFHWLDEEKSLDRIAAVLKPGGWWACWWTEYGAPDRGDPFHEATQHLMQGVQPGPSKRLDIGTANAGEQTHLAWSFSSDAAARISAIKRTGRFEEIRHRWFPFTHRSSAEDVRALYSTFSPVLRLPETERTSLLDGIERIAKDEFGGTVDRPMSVNLYIARRI